jgi:hypothetical protein
MPITRYTSKGQLIPLVFGQTDLAVSQTDVQLVAAIGETGQAVDGYTMPFPGDIVGVSWAFTTAPTAGTMTVGATVGGTEDADTTASVVVDSTATAGYKRVGRGSAGFNAGDVVGAEISTNGSFAPITADVLVTVWVIVYMDGI